MSADAAGNLKAHLCVPASGAFRQAALDFAQALAAEAGFEPSEQRRARLAVEETLEFLFRTALACGEGAPVEIDFEVLADGLQVRITEKGLPLDLDRLPRFAADAALETEPGAGLSLHLARNLVDRFEFENRGRDGLSVTLFKKREGLHVMHRMAAEAPAGAAMAESGDVEIRPAREEEALEISRCAYLTYGYSYEDYVYYPERLAEMNRRGELRSLVAVAPNGAVAGHVALKFEEGRAERAELGVLFVRPECRRQGVGRKLWSAAVESARGMGLQCVIARSVTGHQGSQAMAMAHGFADCALYLALFPRAVDLKSLGGVQAGKMSGMLQWLGLGAPRRRRLDVPARHAGIVEELYRRAEIPFEVLPASAAPAGEEPSIRVRRMAILNVAHVEVARIGAQPARTAQWIVAALRRLCREKMDTIYVQLALEQAGAAEVAEACAREGFLFAGISPGAFAEGDSLAMQYLNAPEDPFEQMAVWTPTAELLRDYVREEWRTQEPPMEEVRP
jgi:anti-sigma regulatory factor (Ser/Thr protein kinase)/GNAT superfamily N-acetyltransferase